MMEMIRRALVWTAFNVRLGRPNPWILGLALGTMPRRAPNDSRNDRGGD
jgi:hypothetical protein